MVGTEAEEEEENIPVDCSMAPMAQKSDSGEAKDKVLIRELRVEVQKRDFETFLEDDVKNWRDIFGLLLAKKKPL